MELYLNIIPKLGCGSPAGVPHTRVSMIIYSNNVFTRYYDQLEAMEGKLPVSESQVINVQWKCNIFFSSCLSFFRAGFEYCVFHVFFFLQLVFFYMIIIFSCMLLLLVLLNHYLF